MNTRVGIMGLIRTTVGGTDILIETVDIDRAGSFAGMSDTAVNFGEKAPEFVENALKNAQEVIINISKELKDTIINNPLCPDETKVEFALSMSSSGGIWILNAGTQVTLKVELTWKKESKG